MTVFVVSSWCSWLAHSTPERAVRIRALAETLIVLCSWARHLTLVVPLSTDPGKMEGHELCLIVFVFPFSFFLFPSSVIGLEQANINNKILFVATHCLNFEFLLADL